MSETFQNSKGIHPQGRPIQSWEEGAAESLQLDRALFDVLTNIYGSERPIPESTTEPAAIPEQGLGVQVLPDLWAQMVDGGAKLASPWMFGHMDTAPHPAAALTDAVVSALNNNLLFRELSPFSSKVEELLIADFADRLGLPRDTRGMFCSGGSLANLTGLFAGCGGYADVEARSDTWFFVPESHHASIAKSAAILGIPRSQVINVACDESGRIKLDDLRKAFVQCPGANKIAVGVLGNTVTGAVDDLAGMADLCRLHGVWFHVDAVYGGCLAFSRRYRGFLTGLDGADSIAIAPQKWLYVPRLSSLVLFRDEGSFERSLGMDLPYSLTGEDHLGKWGIQGSRRADAVTLWATLQVIGSAGMAEMIDGLIGLGAEFNELLNQSPQATPLHRPDLNIQVFRWGEPDAEGAHLKDLHRSLTDAGYGWLSLSSWQGENVLRAVLLNPRTGLEHLRDLLKQLEQLD